MQEVLFSVITITYNDIENFKLTNKSVQSQRIGNFKVEYIVIDGGSTDGTTLYLEEESKNIDMIISEEDKGIYDAMNKGIEQANGKYLIFMNAGDTFASPSTLNEISKNIKTNDFPDFIYGDSIEIAAQSDDEMYKKSRSYKYIWYGLFIQHQSIVYNQELIKQNNIRYRTEYTLGADYAFTYEVLKLSQNIIYISVPICRFKLGGASSTSSSLALDDHNRIRNDVMKYSLAQRLSITFLHKFMYFIRIYLPIIHKLIQTKSSKYE